jgi:hypothetical protein
MELALRQEASRALSSIEVALAGWEQLENKPAHLGGRVRFLENCALKISLWMKNSLRGETDGESVKGRLENFAVLMHELGDEGGEA